MTEQLLPDLLTPCSPADLYAALRAAWPDMCPGDPCTRASLLVLLGQWALETGWGKSCHRWNLGNAKHVPGDGHDYVQFRCSEVIGGKEIFFDPPNPATSFVAFPTLDEGARYYLGSLRHRFAFAWPSVLAGDPAGFSHALKVAHYYTADEALYTHAMVGTVAHAAALIPADPDPDETLPTA